MRQSSPHPRSRRLPRHRRRSARPNGRDVRQRRDRPHFVGRRCEGGRRERRPRLPGGVVFTGEVGEPSFASGILQRDVNGDASTAIVSLRPNGSGSTSCLSSRTGRPTRGECVAIRVWSNSDPVLPPMPRIEPIRPLHRGEFRPRCRSKHSRPVACRWRARVYIHVPLVVFGVPQVVVGMSSIDTSGDGHGHDQWHGGRRPPHGDDGR